LVTNGNQTTNDSQWGATVRRIAGNQTAILLVVLLSLVAVFSYLQPLFFTAQTASNILTDWGSVVLIAVGATFVIISGGIDLSVGATIGLSGVVAAWFMVNVAQIPQDASGVQVYQALALGTVVAVAVGLTVGAINAALINLARIPPFIATLATMGAGTGFSVIISGGMPIGGPNDFALVSPFSPDTNPFSWVVLVSTLIVIVLGLFLHKSRFGLHTYAIGSNVFAARAAGINVERHLTKVYMLAGGLAGVAGMYVYIRLGAGSPSSGSLRELDAIAAVVIGGASLMGGVGRIIGTVLGTLVLFTVQSGLIMIGVEPDWKKVVVAVLIATAVAVQTARSKRRVV
jgi:ribose transport system permease protein